VMQMIVYDIWCTVEETRIYDIAFVESLRMTHFYSPQLAVMLGKIRTRIAQSFGAVLAMSRRLEVEMQRLHTQWGEIGESFHKESSMRQAAQYRTEQLQAQVAMLETRALANHDVPGGVVGQKEEALVRLQSEVVALTKKLRSLRASNTTLKTAEIELRLTNEGLHSELSRWRAQFGATLPQQGAPASAPDHAAPPADNGTVSTPPAAMSHVLQAFKSMSRAEQQECLKALHKHAAESLPI